MQKLVVTKPWPGPSRIFKPGEYSIPSEISRTHARCCFLDGCGEIVVTEATKEPEPFRGGKKPAPENKWRGSSPERKGKVG